MSSDGHDLNKKNIELDHMHTFIVHNLCIRSHLNIMYLYQGVSIVDLFLQQHGFAWKFYELQKLSILLSSTTFI
jgi:hypothetical protein